MSAWVHISFLFFFFEMSLSTTDKRPLDQVDTTLESSSLEDTEKKQKTDKGSNMSRLYLKNLPPFVTKQALRNYLAGLGAEIAFIDRPKKATWATVGLKVITLILTHTCYLHFYHRTLHL
jgi:RNA recognition motif-containing protein